MKASTAMLWSGLAMAPLAWFLNLEANFALVPLACVGQTKRMLYAVSGVTFVLAILGGSCSWIQHEGIGEQQEERTEVQARKQGMAIAGLVLSLLFALVILAQSIPNLLLPECE